ncbi:MAG TPA: class I SAM-dependent methyltransferase [Acidimicrobiales bacterium]|nr:class I SAM-dependent methyltransferase [Acidimicrobiales bacterium]
MTKGITRAIGRRIPSVKRLLEQRDALAGQTATQASELLSLRDTLAERASEAQSLRDTLAERASEVQSLRDTLAGQAREMKPWRALPWPPGHFYSPLPSVDEVRSRSAQIFRYPTELPEIDLEADAQLDLVRDLSPFAHEAAFPDHPDEKFRYYFANDFFSYGDGTVLHCMLRLLQPSRIVEIGSGHSSALILDTNERNLGGLMRCAFIEPYPDRLMSLLRGDDDSRAEIYKSPLQDVAGEVIGTLRANDVLFIDSSHVSKIGSDVNLLIFEVLPALPKGVFVHFHDIFYPFEYPESWAYEGRGWNEAYILRAYLQANAGYRIRLWNPYLARFHRAEVARELPKWGRNPGGSIWLERV